MGADLLPSLLAVLLLLTTLLVEVAAVNRCRHVVSV
jgi:hypothetical protein